MSILKNNILSTPSITFSEALLKVYHDNTLFGDGTRSNPLKVIGGGGGGGSVTSITGSSVDNTNPTTPIINAIPMNAVGLGLTAIAGDFKWESQPPPNSDLFKTTLAWGTAFNPQTGILESALNNGSLNIITGDNAENRAYFQTTPEEARIQIGASNPGGSRVELSISNYAFIINTYSGFSGGYRSIDIHSGAGDYPIIFNNTAGGGFNFESATGGIVLPILSTTQIGDITSPVTATLLYNTNSHKLQFFNGTRWVDIGGDSLGYGFIDGGNAGYVPEFSRVISSDNLGMSTELSFSYGLGPVYGIPVFGFTTSLGSDKESSVGFCQDGGDILYSLEHKYLSETFLNSCTYAGMTWSATTALRNTNLYFDEYGLQINASGAGASFFYASDYSAHIVVNDRRIPDVGTVKQLATKVYSGTKTATGTATTTFTVTIGTTQANTTYKVNTEALNLLSSPVRYINNKTTTTFDVVYLSGLTGAVAFDWFVIP